MSDWEAQARKIAAIPGGVFALRPAPRQGWVAELSKVESLDPEGFLSGLGYAVFPSPAEAVADLERRLVERARDSRFVVGARSPYRAEFTYGDDGWEPYEPAHAPGLG